MSKKSRQNRREKCSTPYYFKSPELHGRTENQSKFIKLVRAEDFVVVTGPAGTGKTYIAAAIAAQRYVNGQTRKIILTRPNESMGKTLGLLKGGLEEKFDPWVVPLMEVLEQYMGSVALKRAIACKDVECVPIEYMRGRTFNDAFVIMDEAQNTTPWVMKGFTTRIGENTKVVINGDIRQSDIKGDSGLAVLLDIMHNKDIKGTSLFEFAYEDIVRSRICKEFAIAFDEVGV